MTSRSLDPASNLSESPISAKDKMDAQSNTPTIRQVEPTREAHRLFGAIDQTARPDNANRKEKLYNIPDSKRIAFV